METFKIGFDPCSCEKQTEYRIIQENKHCIVCGGKWNGKLKPKKMESKTTIHIGMSNNAGQVKESDAQEIIDRLNKQQNTIKWRKDYSDFMDCYDETDEDVSNPCERKEGYVWIVKAGVDIGCGILK